MHMDIDTNMQMIGKREPYYATFTVRIVIITTGEFIKICYGLIVIRLAALTVVL